MGLHGSYAGHVSLTDRFYHRPEREVSGKEIAAAEAMSPFRKGDRVSHRIFGLGKVESIEGNKLTVAFEAGEKRVIDTFVEKV